MNTNETSGMAPGVQTDQQPLPNLTYNYHNLWTDHPVLRAAYAAACTDNYAHGGYPNVFILDDMRYFVGVLPELLAAHYALVCFMDHLEDCTDLYVVMRAVDAAVMAECERVEEIPPSDLPYGNDIMMYRKPKDAGERST